MIVLLHLKRDKRPVEDGFIMGQEGLSQATIHRKFFRRRTAALGYC